VLGTPPFMSPEQCRGEEAIEQRSDVYSLGCVLFAMVTGRPPFEAAGGAVLAMHQLEPTPIPSRRVPGLPAVVDHLVLRCMAKHPAERFTAGELARAIAGLLRAPWLDPGERTAAAPCAVPPCDTTAATQPMEAVRPSLAQRVQRTAMVAEVAVLAMVICGMAWLAMVLLSRFVA
jgi:serine/threonine protein kinase